MSVAKKLDEWLRGALKYGSTNKIILASPAAALVLDAELSPSGAWVSAAANETYDRFVVDAYLAGAYGRRIPVSVIRGWADEDTLFMLDLEQFKTTHLSGLRDEFVAA